MNIRTLSLGMLLVPLASYAGRDLHDHIKNRFLDLYIVDRPNGNRFYACRSCKGHVFCYFESGDRTWAKKIDNRWFVLLKKECERAQSQQSGS